MREPKRHAYRNSSAHTDHVLIQLLAKRFIDINRPKNVSKTQAQACHDKILSKKNDELSYSGLNGEVNKKIYAKMMQYFIAEELKRFNHQ